MEPLSSPSNIFFTRTRRVPSGLEDDNKQDMFLCSPTNFLNSYCPCKAITNEEVDACFEKMISEGRVVARDNEGAKEEYVWSAFGDGFPSATDPLVLKEIIHYVLNVGEKRNDMEFVVMANNHLLSDTKGSRRKFDNCAVLRSQMLAACHHIINEDVRRMWIYGLSFEGSLCSAWYFSRSHSVKSVAIEWIEHPKALVRLLLTFAKATPRELGIDPTIHKGPKSADGKPSWVYEVPSNGGGSLFFKTVQAIHNPLHSAIACRPTLVWRVIEVSSASGEHVIGTEEVVLKDVWRNNGGQTETDNLDAIFAAVEEFVDAGIDVLLDENPNATRESLLASPKAMKEIVERDSRFKAFDDVSKEHLCSNLANETYKSLFLTNLHAWNGEVCKPLGNAVWRFPTLFSASSIQDLDDELVEPTEPDSKKVGLISPRFVQKCQSRFIYKEVCTTLHHLDTVGEVVDILSGTMDAMHILFLAGWVHRDLSPTNIMAYRCNSTERWIPKLSGLEFSRVETDHEREHCADPRIGMPFFMPVEILSRQHLLDNYSLHFALELDREHGYVTVADHLAMRFSTSLGHEHIHNLKRFRMLPFCPTIPPNPHWDKVLEYDAPVNFNYQHDLESIWWILLWIITSHVDHQDPVKLQKIYNLFSHNDLENEISRRCAITDNRYLPDESFQKDIKEGFTVHIDALRKSMRRAYFEREIFGHLDLPESYTDIQVTFAQILREIQANPGPWLNMRLKKPPVAVEPSPDSSSESCLSPNSDST